MRPNQFNRRSLLKAGAAGLVMFSPYRRILAENAEPVEPSETFVPVRTITRGPKFHWFGYYDKWEFDPSDRYVLGMEVDVEHRSPRPQDEIRVGMVDLQDDDRWIELGKTTAWCWQQGCMLQWRPGSQHEVLWNDREDGRYVCRILNVESGELRTVHHPIYAVSPDGRWAVTADFRRINDMRPGYGYAGIADPWADQLAPDESGIWRVDLDSGETELVVSLADVAAVPYEKDISAAKHYFNHLLVAPDGERFEFLHRWREPGSRSFTTRMMTAAADGSDMRVIDPSGKTSHFIWRDPRQILAWSWHPSHGNAFYLFEDAVDGSVEPVGPDVMTRNGHCTYLPGNEWILNDTYPDAQRRQEVYLYHVASERRVVLGRFYLPSQYTGEWRCDTHPRFSRDGTKVVIDSPHTGAGRQLHLLDISDIVAG